MNLSPRPLSVALTGCALSDDAGRAEGAGFDRPLVKPAASHTLAELLSSVSGKT